MTVASLQRSSPANAIFRTVANLDTGFRQIWAAAAAARQHQQHQWHQSLGIGVGVGAVTCSGHGGGGLPPNSSGWSSGGDGSWWGHNQFGTTSTNVVADVAASEQLADTACEDVVLLDVGGALASLT